MRATLPPRPSPPLPYHSLAPGYSSLFLSLLFLCLLYLFSLHLHFFIPAAILLERHGHFHRRAFPYSHSMVPGRAVDIRTSFSRYINTLISNLVISKLTLFYFHADLTWIQEIIDNCVNLDSACIVDTPTPTGIPLIFTLV